MKALALSIALFTVSFQSFAVDPKTVQEINLLDAQKNYQAAVVKSVLAANQIAEEIKFDEIIVAVTSVLQEEQKEVVTSTSNAEAGFNLFGLISASGQRKYDATKILLTNPEEVAAFSHQQADEFKTLQKKIKAYVKKNETKIIEAKMFAARALQLTNKLPVDQISQIYAMAAKTAQRVSIVSFEGSQNIIHCTRLKHERSSNSTKVKFGMFFSWLSAEESTKHHSYTERSCETSTVNVSVVADSSYDLMLADQSISDEMDKLSLKLLKVEAPYYPTWGSSDIKE